MAQVGNIPITQSMIAQLKYNVITFNGRLSIPGVAYFLYARYELILMGASP